ncbi:hypothetical protein ABKN59_005639 [Abortiporus biennis]
MRSLSFITGAIVLCLAIVQTPSVEAKPTAAHHTHASNIARAQQEHNYIDPLKNLFSNVFPSVGKEETNAQRLKRGLTPRKPKRLHVAGRSLYARQSATPTSPDSLPTPTPTLEDPTPTPTPTIPTPTPSDDPTTPTVPDSPPTPTCANVKSGYIQVTGTSDNGKVGSGMTSGWYNMASKNFQPLQVTFCADGGAATPVNFVVADGTSLPDLAFVGIGYGNIVLKKQSSSHAILGSSAETAVGSPVGTTDNSYGKYSYSAQSAIWIIDPTTLAITVRWVNPDGTIPAVTLLYAPSENNFVLVGDVAEYSSHYFGRVVTFTFVPIDPEPEPVPTPVPTISAP